MNKILSTLVFLLLGANILHVQSAAQIIEPSDPATKILLEVKQINDQLNKLNLDYDKIEQDSVGRIQEMYNNPTAYYNRTGQMVSSATEQETSNTAKRLQPIQHEINRLKKQKENLLKEHKKIIEARKTTTTPSTSTSQTFDWNKTLANLSKEQLKDYIDLFKDPIFKEALGVDSQLSQEDFKKIEDDLVKKYSELEN